MTQICSQSKFNWKLADEPDPQKVEEIESALGIAQWLAKLLVQRDVTTLEEAKRFFRPALTHLHDPFLMEGMEKAVDRLNSALEQNETIMVYGDYDVDGTTSVAMLTEFLQSLDAQVISYIPDRYKEGYGVSQEGVEFAHREGVKLMFTLDCGVKAMQPISWAQEHGIDVIVCDHHQPGDALPPALAILDPQKATCNYPYPYLSGAGVTFKLMQAWTIHQGGDVESLQPYLDLLCISIGADIVPMTGENRVMARLGLEQLKDPQRPGIKAMWSAAKYDRSIGSITDVVFGLAPRINAAGRMSSGKLAVDLLACRDQEKANEMAESIEGLNRERKSTDQKITKAALDEAINDPRFDERCTTVVCGEDWHKGVIGIVASRLIEQHFRPTIVLTTQGDLLTGSCRSIPQVNLYEALAACSDILEKWGGHPMAAGVTLHASKLETFKDRFDQAVREQLGDELPQPEILIDAELSFQDITAKSFVILEQMGPFGPENMNPVFASTNVMDTGRTRTVGQDNAHLKGHFKQDYPTSPDLDAIGFSMGHLAEELMLNKKADIVYSLERNTYRDRSTIQLQLKDLRIKE